jgi:hypothetical protein
MMRAEMVANELLIVPPLYRKREYFKDLKTIHECSINIPNSLYI